MQKDYSEIARQKTKDELVHILINKDEFKDELVEAAENELRQRDKENNFDLSIPRPSLALTRQKVETPLGIYLAGILLFLTGPIWIFIGIAQAGVATLANDTATGILSMWNVIVAVLSIAFGIGILKGHKWGYDWGLGTAVVNILWFAYTFIDTEWMFPAFLTLVEILILVSLLSNRKYFADLKVKQENRVLIPSNLAQLGLMSDEQEEGEHLQLIINLNKLIRSDRGTVFGSTNRSQIKELLHALCDNKEKSQELLFGYKKLFGVDLIDDLIRLSNNYDTIKEYCRTFIEHGIVSYRYPHQRLTQDVG